MNRATIRALNIYPVKSARGIPRTKARLTTTGLEWDRHWMVIRENGAFLTQRTHPVLATIATAISEESLILRTGGCTPLVLPLAARGDPRPVSIWKSTCVGLDQGDDAAGWLSAVLREPVRIVRAPEQPSRRVKSEYAGATAAPLAFPDGYPMLVCNRASLDDLNQRMPAALFMERFRPNLVLDGLPPFVEDRLTSIAIGPITLRPVRPCTRCIIPSIDQHTGLPDLNPLPVLRKYRFNAALRGVTFGVYAVITSGVGQILLDGSECHVS